MKKLILLNLFLIFGCSINHDIFSQNAKDSFTIFLVRHSEKDLTTQNYSDPPLSTCGYQRAEFLDSYLDDFELDAIYSTDFKRTKSTANPTAFSKGLSVDLYNPVDLEAFSNFLLDQKQDALVVGHSNTTAVLAGMLVDQKLEAFDESIYNRIYKVEVDKHTATLDLILSPFDCQN